MAVDFLLERVALLSVPEPEDGSEIRNSEPQNAEAARFFGQRSVTGASANGEGIPTYQNKGGWNRPPAASSPRAAGCMFDYLCALSRASPGTLGLGAEAPGRAG